MKQKFLTILSVALLVGLIMASCAPAAAPAEEAVVEEAPAEEAEAEEAPAEEAMEGGFLWTKELRQAIAAAIDREVIVDRVFEGRNIPAYHMVPEGYPYATEPFLDKYGIQDLEMSKQLFEAAGYTEDNPFEFDLWYPPEHYGTTTADVMQVIKEQLEATGVCKVNLQVQNWAEYVDGFVAGDLPFFILGWFPDFVDPDTWLTPFASCEQSPDNGVNYCNEDMDALLQAAAAETDADARADLYEQVGELYADDVPTIPLFFEPEFITYRDGVEGVAIGAPFEFNYDVLSFGADAVPASGSTDTIIIGTTDEVNSLDANDAYATHDWEIIKNTGQGLLGYTPGTADLDPALAADFPVVSEDGLQYTFTLKDGLTFADGTAVTAESFVYAWDRLNTLEGQVSGLVQVYVDTVEAVDDKTIVYTLDYPIGFFSALAATAPFVPVNPAQYPADEIVAYPDVIDGVGAYRMVSHSVGEQMVLEVNPNYSGDAPAIANVIVKYFADPTTMGNAVEKGEIDIAWRTLGPVESARLQEVEGLTVEKIDAPALRYMVFNHTYEK